MTDKTAITVTDHAVLRYLERAHDIDVEKVRDLIGQCCARGVAAGSPVVRLDGYRFLVRDTTIVTCLPDGARVGYDALCDLVNEPRS